MGDSTNNARNEITVGHISKDFAGKFDQKRIYHSRLKSSAATQEARTERLQQRNQENSFFEESEGILYALGIDDLETCMIP